VNVLVIDLYEICLELLEDKISAEKLFEFENKKGSDELLSEAPNRSRAAGHLMTIVLLLACLTMPCPSAAELRGITIKINSRLC
jgi:hypothetical protein